MSGEVTFRAALRIAPSVIEVEGEVVSHGLVLHPSIDFSGHSSTRGYTISEPRTGGFVVCGGTPDEAIASLDAKIARCGGDENFGVWLERAVVRFFASAPDLGKAA